MSTFETAVGSLGAPADATATESTWAPGAAAAGSAFRPETDADPVTPAHRRTARKIARLREAAQLYREALANGSTTPSRDVAARLGIAEGTARNRIFRARSEGLLESVLELSPKPAHRPRVVDWGTDSWHACATCHVQWPCTPADAGNWSD